MIINIKYFPEHFPQIESKIKIKHPKHVLTSYRDEVDRDEVDSDEEYVNSDSGEEDDSLIILHTLNNDRSSHMDMDDNDTWRNERVCLRLHVAFAKAVVELLSNYNKFTAVKDISLEEDEDKLTLSRFLCHHDLIEVKHN